MIKRIMITILVIKELSATDFFVIAAFLQVHVSLARLGQTLISCSVSLLPYLPKIKHKNFFHKYNSN